MFAAAHVDKLSPHGALSMVKDTIVHLPPLRTQPSWSELQAPGWQLSCLQDTAGAAAAPQPFASRPLLLPPTPKAFIGTETSLVENSSPALAL